MGMAMLGLLAALIGVGGSAAAQGPDRASAAKPRAEAAAKNLVRRFGYTKGTDCTIGRWGADPCGKGSYGVLPGKYVRVALAASGGKEIEFKVYKKGTEDELGKVSLEAGDRETIWTNDPEKYDNKRVNVSFTADASGVVETVAKGKFLFGPY